MKKATKSPLVTAEGRRQNARKGAEFESYVASLYEALGYRVERNTRKSGQQIDLIVRKTMAGAGALTIIIECKYLSEGSLSNQEVHNFSAYFQSVRNHLGLTMGIMVCNRDFSTDAKAASQDQPFVQLKRQADLERELFDVTDVLLHKCRTFELEDIFTQYIALSGSGMAPAQKAAKRIPDVLEFLNAWASQSNSGLITILGDFGSGKTTLLQRLEYMLAKSALDFQTSMRIPLFFALRDRGLFRSLDEFVGGMLLKQFQIKIPLSLFWQQLRYGRFVVLLDGFDEISSNVTSHQRADIFYDLNPLIVTRSPAIMTCRPTYFVTAAEYNSLIRKLEKNVDRIAGHTAIPYKISDRLLRKYVERPEYVQISDKNTGEISLDTFDSTKIDAYLKNRNEDFIKAINETWTSVRDFLYRVYDLKDLMSRPILLSMITETVIEGNISLDDHTLIAGPTGLYELYTDLQLQRDQIKGEARRFLSSQQRRYFAQATALAMLNSSTLAVTYKQILEVISHGMETGVKTAPLPPGSTKEQIAADVIVCAFLSRQPNDDFRFVHKSFMEFFLAQFLMETINESNDSSNIFSAIRALNRKYPNETLSFLANYSKMDISFAAKIRAIVNRLDSEDATQGAALLNVNLVALYIANEITGFVFNRAIFSEMSISNSSWNAHVFKKSLFEKTTVSNVRAVRVQITECQITDSDLRNVQFESSKIVGYIKGTKLIDTTLHQVDAELSINGFSGLRIKSVNSKLSLEGNGHFHRSQFRSTDIAIRRSVDIQFHESEFHGCTILPESRMSGQNVKMVDCDIRDSFLLDVQVQHKCRLSELISILSKSQLRGLLHIATGLSSDSSENLRDSKIEILNPGLILVLHGIRSVGSAEIATRLRDIPVEFEKPQELNTWNRFVRGLRSGG